MTTTLVIGIGNTLRGDDGAGVRAADRLAALCPGVDCVTAQQLSPELAETLSHYERVYLLDASVSASVVTRSSVTPATGLRASTASLSAAGLLSLCSSLYGGAPATALVEIPAEQFAFGADLSPRTAAMVESAVEVVVRTLSPV